MTAPADPNRLPTFDDLLSQQVYDYGPRAQTAAYNRDVRQQQISEDNSARLRDAQNLYAIYGQLENYIGQASDELLRFGPGDAPIERLEVYAPGRSGRLSGQEYPLHPLVSERRYGSAPARAYLAPTAGMLVAHHMFVPAEAQARSIGMAPIARDHLINTGYVHFEPVDMYLETSKVFAPPAERALQIGNELARLVVASRRAPMATMPLAPTPQPIIYVPQHQETWHSTHRFKKWLSR
jgi:hypothetical protein